MLLSTRSALLMAAMLAIANAESADAATKVIIDEGPGLNTWLASDDYDDDISNWKYIIRKSELRTYSLTEQFDKVLVKPVRNPSSGKRDITAMMSASVATAHACGVWGNCHCETTF